MWLATAASAKAVWDSESVLIALKIKCGSRIWMCSCNRLNPNLMQDSWFKWEISLTFWVHLRCPLASNYTWNSEKVLVARKFQILTALPNSILSLENRTIWKTWEKATFWKHSEYTHFLLLFLCNIAKMQQSRHNSWKGFARFWSERIFPIFVHIFAIWVVNGFFEI